VPKSVEFYGETFAVNEKPDEFTVMEFAEALTGGVEDGTVAALAIIMRMFKESIAVEDRDAAVQLARKNHAGSEEMFKVIYSGIFSVTERPTEQPSDSSDGLPDTEPKSESKHAAKDSDPFPGRPDKVMALRKTMQVA
jgi:hypothetical protein